MSSTFNWYCFFNKKIFKYVFLFIVFLANKNIKKPPTFVEGLWHHPGSNRGHKDFQSFALPTELQRHPIVQYFSPKPQFNPKTFMNWGANIGQGPLNCKKYGFFIQNQVFTKPK